jgi:hypothetical protein
VHNFHAAKYSGDVIICVPNTIKVVAVNDNEPLPLPSGWLLP